MNDAYWELFTYTGDPVCWLLSRVNARGGKPAAAAGGPVPADTAVFPESGTAGSLSARSDC
jgi:hypothetical protein